MGEFSKRIGDVGENVVVEFLKLIGWLDPQRNTDIDSVDKEHRKVSNGIDGLFHYINPMISNTVEFIHYSSKYSLASYPASKLIPTFKEYYTDLVKTIESYKKSEQNQTTQYYYENIETFFYRGVIFWLNNSKDGEDDILSKLRNIELNTGVEHDGVFLVDNKRILFIYDAINYTKLKYPKGEGYEVEFIYFLNGLNSNDNNIRSGNILPVEFINSSILPMKATKNNETTVILFAIDNFTKEDLMKYFGIAKNIGCNVQGATNICFPDYQESIHRPDVDNLKQTFNEPQFTRSLTVSNYNYQLFN